MRRLLAVMILVHLGGCTSDSNNPGAGNDAGTSTGSDASTIKADGGASTGSDASTATKLTVSSGTWMIYAVTPNPATNIKGTIEAFDAGGGKTRFVLMVSGLPPMTEFGSHLHKLACDDVQAGPHYQNVPPPDGGTAAAAATAMNEVWLDFTTDATGVGKSETTVDWRPRVGEAKAIVVHAMKTAVGGAAGTKLACTSMPF